MLTISDLGGSSHEKVLRGVDNSTGLDAIIAIHSTALGPALGGCRVMQYVDQEAHLMDALRLSKGMTYKNAVAGLEHGGGKTAINFEGKPTKEMLRSFGEFLNVVNQDKYIYRTAGDIGTGARELKIINSVSPHCYYHEHAPDSGVSTAYGVYQSLKQVANQTMPINIEGLGKVGSRLAHLARRDGFKIRVADIDRSYALDFANEHGYEFVELRDIKMMNGAYAPCAIGGTLNDDFVMNSFAVAVCGGANNQCADPSIAQKLKDRGIEYVPDFVANAGGVIAIAMDDMGPLVGVDHPFVKTHLETIGEAVGDILLMSDQSGDSTEKVAIDLADQRIRDQ